MALSFLSGPQPSPSQQPRLSWLSWLNLILKAAGKQTGAGMFWRLLVGIVVLGSAGETGVLPALVGFVIGMCGWAFIVFEIFAGEAGGTVSGCSEAVASNYNTIRLIIPHVVVVML